MFWIELASARTGRDRPDTGTSYASLCGLSEGAATYGLDISGLARALAATPMGLV